MKLHLNIKHFEKFARCAQKACYIHEYPSYKRGGKLMPIPCKLPLPLLDFDDDDDDDRGGYTPLQATITTIRL
jgi:hypothetical protein